MPNPFLPGMPSINVGLIVKNIMELGLRAMGGLLSAIKKFTFGSLWKLIVSFLVWIVLGAFFGPIVAKIWTVTVRIWLVYFTYAFWTDWLIYQVQPVIINGLNLLPSPLLVVFKHIWEAVKATNQFLPWQELGTIIKWLVLVKLFFLSFHLINYVWDKLRQFIMFMTA